jgi:hypothetical protein
MNMAYKMKRPVIGLILTALLTTGLVIAGSYMFGRKATSEGFVREGSETVGPSGPQANLSPSPTYKLPPDGQILARAAFYDLSAGERAGMCAFFAELPKDAVRQAVDAGIRPADARALVNFIAKELCP